MQKKPNQNKPNPLWETTLYLPEWLYVKWLTMLSVGEDVGLEGEHSWNTSGNFNVHKLHWETIW